MEFSERISLTEHRDHLEFQLLPASIYFVHQGGVEFRAALMDAFKVWVVKQNSLLQVNWINDEQVPHVLPTIKNAKDAVFVCEEFHGATFSLLRRRKMKIIGPECLDSQENPLQLSRNSCLPMYSTLMKNVTVCFSGLGTKQMKKMQEKIVLMGGCFCGPFRAPVTHLVTNSVNTAKYRAAVRLGVKIMSPTWIQELWKQSLLGNYADRDRILCILAAEHTLPYLHGLTICICPVLNKITGGSYQTLVKSGSGTLSLDPTDPAVTLFVCQDLTSSSPRLASCILPKWLLDSACARACQDWNDYHVPNLPVSEPKPVVVSRPVSISRKRAASPCMTTTPFKPLSMDDAQLTNPQSDALNTSFGFTLPQPVKKSKTPHAARPSKATQDAVAAVATTSKLFHDENACDGLSEETIPCKNTAKKVLLPVDTGSSSSQPPLACQRNGNSDSACDVVFSDSRTELGCSSAPVNPPSSSVTDNLARMILDLVPSSQARKGAINSPIKLSREKLLRPGRHSFDRNYQYSLTSPYMEESPLQTTALTDGLGIDWEEEASSESSLVPDKISPPSSLEVPTGRKKVVFMVCRLKDYDKNKLSLLVAGMKTIGAEYLHGPAFDERCTHLLCDRPHFTEKFLGCCAAGKWILSDQYLHDSVKAGYFLEEPQYEWGNVFAGRLMKDLNDTELRWASSGHWWRCHIDLFGKRAFADWKVILGPDIPRLESYSNVLRAGSATILSSLPEHADQATHLLHNFGRSPDDEQKLKAFRDGLPGLTAESHEKNYLDRFLLQKAIGASELRRAMAASVSAPRKTSQAFSQSVGPSHRLTGTLAKRSRMEPPSSAVSKK